MINLSDFVYIDSCSSLVGIDKTDAERIISLLPPGKLKKEHVEASSPAKKISVSPFYISKRLITVREFREFADSTSYISESEREGWGWVWESSWRKRDGVSWKRPFGDEADIIYNENAEKLPVMQVSWNDAVAYTEWLSLREGRRVRIPGEFEWEIFAAKAGIKSMSQLSDSNQPEIKNSGEFIRLLKFKLSETIYDLGLLWEWTFDWYNGYSPDSAAKDFGNVYKVLRGGSLLSEEIQKTREFRFRRCPTARSPYYGFRIVLTDL